MILEALAPQLNAFTKAAEAAAALASVFSKPVIPQPGLLSPSAEEYVFETGSSCSGLSAVDDVVKAVVSGERRIVVVDVEATCGKKGVFTGSSLRTFAIIEHKECEHEAKEHDLPLVRQGRA